MRHARKAATPATMALLLTATLSASIVAGAQATDSPGGTPAPTGATTAKPASTTRSGGTDVPGSASATATSSGGAVAPSTKGTGGSEYGVVVAKPRVARKLASRKPSHAVHRPRVAPKPKVSPPKRVTPAPPVSTGPTPGVPTPVQTAGEGAVFPVIGPHSFGEAANRFGAGRVGHIHQGQDVLASEGLAVVAPLAGTIVTTAYQAGGAGWYVAEHTLDGLDFFYAHCQAGSLAVSTGEVVSAGQTVCKLGQTGDATGPHLHFEVWVGGWHVTGGYPIDPLPYLEAWDHPVGG